METQTYLAEIADLMNPHLDQAIPQNAEFYQTDNGYWIAFTPEWAAILLPDERGCDWIEGADTLGELVSLIESGEYEELFLSEENQEHEHGENCSCGQHHSH